MSLAKFPFLCRAWNGIDIALIFYKFRQPSFFLFTFIFYSLNMGANLSKALSKMFGSKEMRILMLGLDAAGKTSQ
jgi:hypothetical protein